jgi:hypothetical protein
VGPGASVAPRNAKKQTHVKNLLLVSLILLCQWAYAQPAFVQDVTEIKAIPYYQGPDYDSANHKLNLVLPKAVKNPPLLVWIGGGAWSYVNRDMEMDVARKFAQKGIAVASLGHRLSPATWKDPALKEGIKHPEHIKDVARAIKYLYAHAGKYGYTPSKIFVGGYSSGGHLSALVVMDGQYLKKEGLSKDIIKGVIPIAGTYDVAHYHQVLAAANGRAFADNHVGSVFGLTKQEFEKYSPTTYADSLSTPMLLISETNTFKYTNLFEDRLRERDYKNLEVLHIHRLNHGELWKHLSHSPQSIYRDVIEDFIRRNADNIVP